MFEGLCIAQPISRGVIGWWFPVIVFISVVLVVGSFLYITINSLVYCMSQVTPCTRLNPLGLAAHTHIWVQTYKIKIW